jgi:1,2-phenylacetyl-CoA epoxidase PaaB subunit
MAVSPVPTAPPAGVREEAKPSLRPVWVVFARRKYADPLYEVGTVRAENADMAAVFAQSIYDEHPWIEMIVVPRSSIKTVIVP